MKTIFKLFICMSLLGLLIWSCNKTKLSDDLPDQFPGLVSPIDLEYSQGIIARIDAFREKMNSPLKVEQMMTLEDAVWNIEALINADLAEPWQPSHDQIVFVSYHPYTLDENGLIAESQVQEILDDITQAIIQEFSIIPTNEKFIRFTDVALGEDPDHNEVMVATTGFNLNFILGTYWPFDPDDDWIWGTLGEEFGQPPAGKCDGTQIGVSDGSNELEWRLNNPVTVGQGTAYTDIEIVEVGFWNVDQLNAERTYWGQTYDDCLDDQELTELLISADQLYNEFNDNIEYIELDEGARPVGKDFISTAIEDALTPSPRGVIYFHVHLIKYGVPYVIPD